MSDGNPKINVTWRPNIETSGNPGSHFYVKLRKEGEPTWLNLDPIFNQEHFEVADIEPDTPYEMRVVAVDGNQETESDIQRIIASDSGKIYF